MRKAVQLMVLQGLVEMGAGSIVIFILLVLGSVTGAIGSEGQTVMTVLGGIFLALIGVLVLVAKDYMEGIRQPPPEPDK